MSVGVALFALEVMGPFRLTGPGGNRINISSKKGQALVAMLAVAGNGERTRSWLQGQLWGSRGQDQAQASLRSEISSLRRLLNSGDRPLIDSDHARVWIDLSLIHVDARNGQSQSLPKGVFLEGLDIAGEEGFEEWLRDERAHVADRKPAISFEPPPSGAAGLPVAAQPAFAIRPAIAVLPFVNQTGDPGQDFLAEGMSEDLIDRLSRLRWIPVIARSSSFALEDANADPKIIGAALGARYLLEGRVRATTGTAELSVSLADCETGRAVWSNKFALSRDDGPDGLADLLAGIATALGARIDVEEQARAVQKPHSDLKVRDLIWRGRWHLNRLSEDDVAQAKACFTEALEREPNSPEATIQLAWAHLWELWTRRGSDDDIRLVRKMAQKAIIADYDDARGHMLAGIAEKWLRQPLRAEALLSRAIELNPSLAMAHAQLGGSQYLRDAPAEAIAKLENAIRLSPNDAELFYFRGELAMAFLMTGAFDEALEQADLSLMRRGAYWFSHVVKINALARSGDWASAQAALSDLAASNSGFVPKFIDWIPFMDGRWNRYLAEGLNLAMAQTDRG